jgi:hypothetical protein
MKRLVALVGIGTAMLANAEEPRGASASWSAWAADGGTRGTSRADGASAPVAARGEGDDDAAETTFVPRKEAPPAAPPLRPTMDSFAELSTTDFKLGPMRARYSLNVFGDVGAHIDNNPTGNPTDHPSFFLGFLDLLLGLRLEQGFSGVAEVKFGVNDGVVASAATPGAISAVGTVDLERFGLRWENDNFFVEAGREHTEIGYWNNAYHHGTWLQPTYARPRWIGFGETGLVPVHRIGLLGGVKAPVGGGQLKVSFSVNNSRGQVRTDVRNKADLLDLKMLHASIEYLGLGVRELRLGVSGVLDEIPPAPKTVRPTLPDVPIDEAIGSFYVTYVGALVLIDVETFYVHQQHDALVWRNYGGFAVASVTWRALSPYVMLERIWRDGPPSPYYVPVPTAANALSTDNFTFNLGLRYDLSSWNALKVEYRFSRFYDQASLMVHEVTLSWNFGV